MGVEDAPAGEMSLAEARAALGSPIADDATRARALRHLEHVGGGKARLVTAVEEEGAGPAPVGAYRSWRVTVTGSAAMLVTMPGAGDLPSASEAVALVPGAPVPAAAPRLVALDSAPEGATLRMLDPEAGTVTELGAAELHVLTAGEVVAQSGGASLSEKVLRLVELPALGERWRSPLASFYFADVAALGPRFVVAASRTDMFYGVALSASDDAREAFGATVYDRTTGQALLHAGGVLGVLPDGERLVVCDGATGHTHVVRAGAPGPEHVLPTTTCAGTVVSAGERLFWAPVRQHEDPVWELDLETGRTASVPVVGRLPSRWGSAAEASAAVQKSALSAGWFLSSDGRHLCVTRHFHVSGSGRMAIGCPITVGATHGIGAAPRALARLDGVVRALPAPLARLFDPETGVTELVRTRDGRHVAAVQRDVPKGELVLGILDGAAARAVRSVRVPLEVGLDPGALRLGDGPSEYRVGTGSGSVVVDAATGIATPSPQPPSTPWSLELCVAGHLAVPRRACAAG